MLRLVLAWAVLTALLFGVRYFLDHFQRKEAARWGLRVLWCATITAAFLAGIIFAERL